MGAEIISFIKELPKEIWAIGGSFIGIIGALLVAAIQDRQQNKRLERQFRHELKVKKDERLLTLKRDIYFDALSAILVTQNYLTTIADADIKGGPQNNAELASKLYKVRLVGTIKTLPLFDKCSILLSDCLFELLPKKLDLEQLYAEQKAEKFLLESFQDRQKHYTHLLENLHVTNNKNEGFWSLVSNECETVGQEIDQLLQKGDPRNTRIFEIRMDLTKTVQPYANQLLAVIGDLLLALREELDEKANEEILAHISKNNALMSE